MRYADIYYCLFASCGRLEVLRKVDGLIMRLVKFIVSILFSRREILYNILPEFGVPIMLVRLFKMCLNQMGSKVQIGKHFSDTSPIHNGLTQRDSVLPLTLNFASEEL